MANQFKEIKSFVSKNTRSTSIEARQLAELVLINEKYEDLVKLVSNYISETEDRFKNIHELGN